jgi:hypothetical protein
MRGIGLPFSPTRQQYLTGGAHPLSVMQSSKVANNKSSSQDGERYIYFNSVLSSTVRLRREPAAEPRERASPASTAGIGARLVDGARVTSHIPLLRVGRAYIGLSSSAWDAPCRRGGWYCCPWGVILSAARMETSLDSLWPRMLTLFRLSLRVRGSGCG